MGVRPGEEVWLSTLTFAATANAVRYCGAEPVFVDVQEADGEILHVLGVLRRGHPVADIVPLRRDGPSWKRPIDRLVVPGLSLAQEILRDRAESE